jgi:hypothetical protein
LKKFATDNIILFFQGELFSKVKERIQKKLDVPDKEFEKVRCSPDVV